MRHARSIFVNSLTSLVVCILIALGWAGISHAQYVKPPLASKSGVISPPDHDMGLSAAEKYHREASETQDPQNKIVLFSKAIVARLDYPEAFLHRGQAYMALKAYMPAMADLGQAVKLKPDYAAAYAQRGRLHRDMHELDQALVDYNQAVNLGLKGY